MTFPRISNRGQVPLYATTFPATENPISEGGKWFDGGINPGRTSIQTGALVGGGTGAFGTQTDPASPPFLDSVAVIPGLGPNCWIEFDLANRSAAGGHEPGVVFRWVMSAGQFRGYQSNIYLPLVKMSLGRQDDANNSTNFQDNVTTNMTMVDGTHFRWEMRGGIFVGFCNGLRVLIEDVSARAGKYWANGPAGITKFWGSGGINEQNRMAMQNFKCGNF